MFSFILVTDYTYPDSRELYKLKLKRCQNNKGSVGSHFLKKNMAFD